MTEYEIVARTLLGRGPVSWGPVVTDRLATAVIDDSGDDPEAYMVAHVLWTMGATVEHHGCPYAPPEPADGDYENNCPICKAFLTALAEEVIGALAEASELAATSETCWACDEWAKLPAGSPGIPFSAVAKSDDIALCNRHWSYWVARWLNADDEAPCSAHLADFERAKPHDSESES